MSIKVSFASKPMTKKDLLIVVKTTKPPVRHSLEISDRNTFLSFTCSITSDAMTISNLYKISYRGSVVS